MGPEEDNIAVRNSRRLDAGANQWDDLHVAKMRRRVEPVGWALTLIELASRFNIDPARIGLPIGAGEEAAVRGVVPRVEILKADTRQIRIAPQKFVSDARAFLNHLTIFNGPTLQELRILQVGVDRDESQSGDGACQVGCSNLAGCIASRYSAGRRSRELGQFAADIALMIEAQSIDQFAQGVYRFGVAETSLLEIGQCRVNFGQGSRVILPVRER